MNPFYWLCWLIVRGFMIVYCRLKRAGIENIPKTGAFILASNHISAADPPFLGSALGRPMHFMAKKELFDNFVLGPVISRLNALPVNRAVFDKNAMKISAEILRNGGGLIMFPEGTRSKTGDLGKGRPGIGMLARTALVPIVPAYIHNSKSVIGIPFSRRRLIIAFGKPISSEWISWVADDKNGYREIAAKVMEQIAELRAGVSEIASN